MEFIDLPQLEPSDIGCSFVLGDDEKFFSGTFFNVMLKDGVKFWGILCGSTKNEANFIKSTIKLDFNDVNWKEMDCDSIKLKIQRIFSEIDHNYINQFEEAVSGVRALIALQVDENSLYIANCGDCRAVLCKRKDCLPHYDRSISIHCLNEIHDIQSTTEQERLNYLGVGINSLGRVLPNGVTYTRAFGHPNHKKYLISSPTVTGPHQISNVFFLLFFSSSVYQVVSTPEEQLGGADRCLADLAMTYLAKESGPEDAAKRILTGLKGQNEGSLPAGGLILQIRKFAPTPIETPLTVSTAVSPTSLFPHSPSPKHILHSLIPNANPNEKIISPDVMKSPVEQIPGIEIENEDSLSPDATKVNILGFTKAKANVPVKSYLDWSVFFQRIPEAKPT